jgi:hypothetical protein
MAAQPKTLDSSQVDSLAGHQWSCRIVESCCFGNFWAPEILRVFLAAGAFYRVISALEGVNPLALKNGHFTQSRLASEKIKHYTHFV